MCPSDGKWNRHTINGPRNKNANWTTCGPPMGPMIRNHLLIHNKRLFLQYLMGEKKRGLTRRIVGLQAVKEITYDGNDD